MVPSTRIVAGTERIRASIDMWSIGCIFAELLTRKPLFSGTSEIDQIGKIIQILGTPSENIWPGYNDLPHAKNINLKQPYNYLKTKFPMLSSNGLDLMNKLLIYCPAKRITAEDALKHPFFTEQPLPKDRQCFRLALPKIYHTSHRQKINFASYLFYFLPNKLSQFRSPQQFQPFPGKGAESLGLRACNDGTTWKFLV